MAVLPICAGRLFMGIKHGVVFPMRPTGIPTHQHKHGKL